MSHADSPGARRAGRLGVALLAAALLVGVAAGAATPAGASDAAAQTAKKKKKKKKKPTQKVRVMTRNVYLGADLSPGLNAGDTNELIDNAGIVVNQVDRTNFPLRSEALANEILQQKPDLVGLQEVAWWRTAPFDLASPATQTEYDFLALLMDRLNAGGERYRVVVSNEEFDFETPVNDVGPSPAGFAGVDRDARLTMRDVILARVGSRVKTSNPIQGTFPTLLRVTVGGNTLDVTRGWTAVDAKVGKSKKFRFVNLHHEAFDSGPSNPTNQGTTVGQGQIREAQAKSLAAPGGPADSKLPVVLLGDLNSDDDTVGADGDVLAYNALVAAGFRPVDTSNPMSCCLSDPELVGGSLADFDHHIDHVMTDSKKVKFVKGFVTGRATFNGLWPSDHNGVTSLLKMPAKSKKKGKKKGKGQ